MQNHFKIDDSALFYGIKGVSVFIFLSLLLSFLAIKGKNYKIVDLLLKRNADVNQKDEFGRTPLIYGLC